MMRELRKSDIERVSELHYRSFENSFFCLLGKEFLPELYMGILASEYTLSYVFEENSEVIGFVTGAIHPDRFFKKLLVSKFLRFSPIILCRALANPKIFSYGLQTIFYSGKTNVSEDAEVLAIAVDDKHRRTDVGSNLLNQLFEAFTAKDARKVKVIVDEDNTPANAFYIKNGFFLARKVTLYDKKMNVYVRTLPLK